MRLVSKFLLGLVFISLLLENMDMTLNSSIITNSVEAHSGRTDSNGGHKDNKNKSGLGSYHYHCGGNPPHLHEDGVCPYNNSVTESTDTNSDKTPNKIEAAAGEEDELKITKSIIKKVQTALKELGYQCGKIDGKLGKTTKKALKEYQEEHNLKVDGIIDKEVLEALDIDYK